MKNILFAFAATLMLVACNSGDTTSPNDAAPEAPAADAAPEAPADPAPPDAAPPDQA